MSHLSSAGNTNDDSLKEIFNTERTTIFSGLKSRHHQEKYYKECLGLIVSTKYTCISIK